MHPAVFGISFLLRSVNLILIILFHILLIPLVSAHLSNHHHSHHPSLLRSSIPNSKHTFPQILPTLHSHWTAFTKSGLLNGYLVLVFSVIFLVWYACYANDTLTRNRYRKPVPENLYRFSAGVSSQSVSVFFRYRNLVRSRTMFYSVQETVTKMTSTDWSDDRQLCCLLFYCFKMNWRDSNIEKLI